MHWVSYRALMSFAVCMLTAGTHDTKASSGRYWIRAKEYACLNHHMITPRPSTVFVPLGAGVLGSVLDHDTLMA